MERDTDLEEKPDAADRQDDPVADEALTWFLSLREAGPEAPARQDFARWLRLDPRHGEAYRAVEAVWHSAEFGLAAAAAAPRPAPAPSPALATARRRALPSARAAAPRRWAGLSPRRLAQAACLVLAVAGAAAIFGPGLLVQWKADVQTATGERRTFALPDGSTMMLNTASAASFDFADGRRGVRLLSGEAFFDVRHDPAHPFRVTSRFGKVEVLGTAFDVRMDGAADEVALERGHVRVTSLSGGEASVELRPGEAVTAGGEALSAVRSADLAALLGWREGRIAFADRPLSDILAELGRYRPGPVLVVDEKARRQVLSGSYRLDNIEGAIGMLAETAGLSATRLPGGITILH
ncbi:MULTISPECIES: FecR family protein [unclassified Aureimonas]|uniref:FecR family protein n=1 Tax=unclassified Aureimonas TaxID=2615206 RepID=UPI0006F214CE|nr:MULTISPECIES: FecR domain-containing protein [unclassified Aureimonas]KQT60721.1 hypothetical protein ASG54_25050 [Aureimonas sp. Leaf460]KQT68850.1 hypothetical protein ASG62_18570 [Aureimonas sp. Leaf427]